MVAGRDVEPSTVESFDNDVGDVLAVELGEMVDDPGRTIGTSFSVLHCIFSIVGKIWFLITGPLVRGSVIFAELSKR